MSALFATHSEKLQAALQACRTRESYSGWPENPSSKLHGEAPPAAGKARFDAQLNTAFALEQPAETGRVGEELSPYTGEPLGVSYPLVDIPRLYSHIAAAQPGWAKTTPEERIGVCMEILERCGDQLFENAHATGSE